MYEGKLCGVQPAVITRLGSLPTEARGREISGGKPFVTTKRKRTNSCASSGISLLHNKSGLLVTRRNTGYQSDSKCSLGSRRILIFDLDSYTR